MLRKELLDAVRSVHAGHKRIPPQIATQLAEHSGDTRLTPRETQVLQLVAAGNSNRTLAAKLSVSEETVKMHVKNILSKLDAKDRTHAVTIALRRGMIEL
jgi:DNA-binding NarL/FixJ family response regulator